MSMKFRQCVPDARLLACVALFFLPFQLLFGENVFYEFGPKTDNVVVFTSSVGSDNQSTTATLQLQAFAKRLSQQAPEVHTIIAVTKNDISELPPDIPVKRFEGIKTLIQTLSSYPNAVVCFIEAGDRHKAKIITGTSAGTVPAWLLQSAYKSLQQEHIAIDFYPNDLIFHRLGWLPDDPVLMLYNEAKIPTIKLETNADLSAFFSSFSAAVMQDIKSEWDVHYFVRKANDKLIIVNERQIILILIVSLMLILLWLMFFSFLFGKKREQHVKDFLILWWMPLYFFLVNLIGLLIGSKVAELLFFVRFSSIVEMNSFPLITLSVKYVCALFFMFVFTFFHKCIPLPANRFIYGFMGHAVCLLNVFIFSFINLSFSMTFLLIYCISLIAYQFKSIILQIIFIVCLFLPIAPIVIHIIRYRHYLFHIVFFINVIPAFVFIPFDLFLIRLSLSIDKKREKTVSRLKIPIQCKLMGSMFLALILWVFVMPVKQNTVYNDFILLQRLDETGSSVVKKYTHQTREDTVSNYERNSDSLTSELVDSFLTVQTSLENYFERSIGTITVNSPLKVEALSITVHVQNEVAIFEADKAFDQNSSGDTAYFVSPPRPTMPFVIHFSGKKNAGLAVTVSLWSHENPFGITLAADSGMNGKAADGSEKPPFLLTVEKKLHVAVRSASM